MRNIGACIDILPIRIRINVDKKNEGEIKVLTKYFNDEKSWTGSDNPTFYISPVGDQDGSYSAGKSICFQDEEFAKINLNHLKASYIKNRENVADNFFQSVRQYFVPPNLSVILLLTLKAFYITAITISVSRNAAEGMFQSHY
jgi:hypothetical protein